MLEYWNSNILISSIRLLILSTTFLRLLAGLTVNISVSEQTLVAEFASRFRFLILTYGRMPTVTRRIRAIPFHVFFARSLTFFLDGLLLPGAFPLESLLPSICVCVFGAGGGRLCWLFTIISVAETARVSSWTLSICFPLIAFSHSPVNADVFPFLTFD